MIAQYIGLIFVLFGLLEIIGSRWFCGFLCSACTLTVLQPCVLLYIFVGIIFIGVGSSLILDRSFINPKTKARLEYR